jgi:hypothetical protein
MSWDSFDRMLDQRPGVAPAARQVVAALRSMPAGLGIDPLVVARRANVSEVHAVAALGLLLQAKLGAFVIQVVNDRGQSVGEFPSLDDTPGSTAISSP